MHPIKNHLQSIVAAKIPDAFVTKTSQITAVTTTGIPQIDALIQGLPHGAITEIYGPASSGRTTLALSFLAEVTRQQQVCTIVDTSDSFDPESLAAAGADLNRVLWVRCGGADTSKEPTSAFTASSLSDFRQEAFHRTQTFTSGRHPRDEIRGMSQAISVLMHCRSGNEPTPAASAVPKRRFSGEPPMPRSGTTFDENTVPPWTRGDFRGGVEHGNKPTPAMRDRVESSQDPTSAPPLPRRGFSEECPTPLPLGSATFDENASCPSSLSFSSSAFSEGTSRARRRGRFSEQTSLTRRPSNKGQNPWSRLEQALKVTDLILHNGGFGAVLMDLGDVPSLNARRIPLATWFRFRRAVDNTPTIFLLLTREPCAQTCASLVLRCQLCRERWSQAAESNDASKVVTLQGLELEVEVMRRQTQHARTANSANWQTRMHGSSGT